MFVFYFYIFDYTVCYFITFWNTESDGSVGKLDLAYTSEGVGVVVFVVVVVLIQIILINNE